MDNNSSQFLYGTPSPIGQVTNISINDPVRVAYGSLDKAMIKIGNGTDSMIAFGYDTDLKSAIVVAHGMLASSKIIDISVKDKEIGNTIDITYVDTNSKAIKHLSFDTIDDEDALELLQTFNTSLITLLNDVSDGLYNKINDTSDAIIEYIDTQDSSLLKLLNDVSDGILEELKKDELAMSNSFIALADAAGTIDANNNIAYYPNANASYISTATSLANADDILDAAIADVADSVKDISLDIFNASTALKQYIDAQDTSIVNKFNDVSEGLFKKINDTSNALKTYIDDQDSSLLSLLNDVSDGLYDLIQNSSSSLKDYIDTQDTSIVNKFNDVSEGLFKKINDTSNALKTYIDAQDTSIVNKLNDVSEGLFKKINDTSNALKTYIDAQDTSIVNKLNDVSDGIISKFNDVSDGLYNLIIDSSSSLKDYIDAQDTSIVNKLNDVSEGLFKKINDTSNALKTYIDAQDTSIVNKLNDVSDGIISKFNDVSDGLYNLIMDTSDSLKEYIDTQDSSLLALLNDVSDGIVTEIINNERVILESFSSLSDATGLVNSSGNISYVPDSNTSYISGATSLYEADSLLDAAIQNLSESIPDVDDIKEYVDTQDSSLLQLLNDVSEGIIRELEDDEEVVATAISTICIATGTINSSGEVKYVPDTDTSYISGATSLAEADSLLDAAIKDVADAISGLDDIKEYIDTQDTSIVSLFNDVSDGIVKELQDNEEIVANTVSSICVASGILNSSGKIEYVQDENATYISNATSLSDADSLLDAAISDIIADVSDIREYVDTQDSSLLQLLNDVSDGIVTEIIHNERVILESFSSLSEATGIVNTSGNISYVPDLDASYISGATSLAEADSLLDAAIQNLSESIPDVDDIKEYVDTQDSSLLQLLNDVSEGIISEILEDEAALANNIITLAQSAGTLNSSGDIEYIPDLSSAFISSATSLSEADSLLDEAISDLADSIAELDNIREYIDTQDTSIVSLLNDVSDGIISTLNDVSDGIIITLNDVSDGIISTLNDVSDGIISTLNDVSDGLYNKLIEDEQMISTALSQLQNALNDVSDGIIRELEDDEMVISEAITSLVGVTGAINSSGNIEYMPDENATYISEATSLSDADSLLDAAISDIIADVSDIKEYVDTQDSSLLQLLNDVSDGIINEILEDEEVTQKSIVALGTAAGTLDSSGNIVYIPDPNAAFVSEATSLADAIMILDDALANFSPSGDSSLMQLLNDVSDGIIRELQDDEDVIADSIISIGEAAGILNSSNAISYTSDASATYISSAQSLYQADVLLDAALSDLSDDLSGLQVYIDNSINSVKTIIADVSQAKADKVKIVNHGTSDTTFALTPNVHHEWGTVSSLTLTLAAPTDNTIVNEYQFSFTSPTVPTTLSLPASVDWVFELIVEGGKTYTVSIVNNLATYLTSDMSIIGADEAVLALKEDIANKVTSIDANSTDIQYPSAKCVYDYIEARLAQLNSSNISFNQGSESYNDF